MKEDYKNKIITLIEKDIVNQKKYNYYKNESLVNTYFEIGKLLVEAQGGEERAKYGNSLIKKWSEKLVKKYGKGYDESNLRRFRQFYLTFEICGTLCHTLSWSIIRYLLPIKNINKRNYYINLCIKNNLSVRKLKQEIKSESFERLSLANKNNIKLITNKDDMLIKDTFKDPFLIYTNINEDKIDEKTLKEIILEKIEKNILELGVGFSFIGSEVRLDNHRCDLLFFNVEYDCYVVIELKTRKLQASDVGQIEGYINYIDKNIKKERHNNTIGIIMTKENNYYVMKYCSNPNIYETTYRIIPN